MPSCSAPQRGLTRSGIYVLNLQGDVEHALRTPPMRPGGIQDELCEPPTHQMSYANRPSMRCMEQGGFMLCSKEDMEELRKTPLSGKKMKKVDSVLAQLTLNIDSARSIQIAIGRAQLIVPALCNRLEKVKSLLQGEKLQLSHYKAKC